MPCGLRAHVEVVAPGMVKERARVGTRDEGAAAVVAAAGPRLRRDVVVSYPDLHDDASRSGPPQIEEEGLRARGQRQLPTEARLVDRVDRRREVAVRCPVPLWPNRDVGEIDDARPADAHSGRRHREPGGQGGGDCVAHAWPVPGNQRSQPGPPQSAWYA